MIDSRSSAALSRLALCAALVLPLICQAGDSPGPALKASASTLSSTPALIPAPTSLRMRKGSFTIDANTPLRADGEAAQSAARLFSGFVRP